VREQCLAVGQVGDGVGVHQPAAHGVDPRPRGQLHRELAHQGLQARGDDKANQIRTIGRRFGEFDLVLGGHLHWVLPGGRIGKVDYAQSGSGGGGVMKIDLVYDTVEQAVVEKHFDFLPVEAGTPEDPDLAKLAAADLAKADEWLDTVLGRTERDLDWSTAGAGLCPVRQLLCAAIAAGTGADVVMHGILSTESIPAGDIRVRDVWKIVPYENGVGCARLNRAEIRAILEEAAEYLGTHRYFGAWGLRYEVHPDAPQGRRIRNLRLADGSPLNARRRLKVAFNTYHLSGGGGRFDALVEAVNRPNARLKLEGRVTRDLVIDYIRAHPALDIPAGTNAVVVRGGAESD